MHLDRNDDAPRVVLEGAVLADARRLAADAVLLTASMLDSRIPVQYVPSLVEEIAESVSIVDALGGTPFKAPGELDGVLTKGQVRKLRRIAGEQAECSKLFLKDPCDDRARRRVEALLDRAERVRTALKAGRQ